MSGQHIHGSAVIVGEAGVLILGRSGIGKSTLARTLYEQAVAAGRFARLVGDDRLSLHARNGRLIVRAHPLIAGKIEVRGLGIEALPHEDAGHIRLVVEFVDTVERLPEGDATREIAGLAIPLLRVAHGDARAASLVLARLDRI